MMPSSMSAYTRPFAARLGVLLLAGAAAPALAATRCPTIGPNAAMQVDADCVDPDYNNETFLIDSVTQQVSPSPHTRVKAHFKASAAAPQFNVTIYLPPKQAWQGRFFQHVYPLHQDENTGDIAFALSSGGYLVNVEGVPCGCGGYRPDAAAAKLARAYAERLYGPRKRIYGYVWGGSGGSFQTIGAVENTRGIWNGAVPFVIANESALVNYNAMMALAGLALKDKMAAIADAVKPGGSGDPTAVLDGEQRAIFTEALRMGVPLRGFEATAMFSPAMLGFLAGSVFANDPGYTDDFWTKPGYEGSNPPAFLKAAIVDRDATIRRIVRDGAGKPTGVVAEPRLASDAESVEGSLFGPDGKPLARTLSFAPGGSSVLGQSQTNDIAERDADVLSLSPFNDPAIVRTMKEGDRLHLSNRRMLAMMFYHRHALPRARDLYVYDQYRRADGTPIYPQRDFSASRAGMISTSGGGTQTGKINAKIIIVDNLVDVSAFPYGADYYAGKVRRTMGDMAYADSVRVWYQDNADHFDDAVIRPDNATRLVTYVPVLYQALRDMTAWVEKGTPPPATTDYRISDGQVVVPADARERRGVQPVVTLTADGGASARVKIGQPVTLKGTVAVPPGAGAVVAADWDFDGKGIFPEHSPVPARAATITVTVTHSFDQAGVYFPALRGVSQRQGGTVTPLTRIQNLGRVRVVVR